MFLHLHQATVQQERLVTTGKFKETHSRYCAPIDGNLLGNIWTNDDQPSYFGVSYFQINPPEFDNAHWTPFGSAGWKIDKSAHWKMDNCPVFRSMIWLIISVVYIFFKSCALSRTSSETPSPWPHDLAQLGCRKPLLDGSRWYPLTNCVWDKIDKISIPSGQHCKRALQPDCISFEQRESWSMSLQTFHGF